MLIFKINEFFVNSNFFLKKRECWDNIFVEFKVIEKLSGLDDFIYCRTPLAFKIRSRDFVLRRVVKFNYP